MKDPLFPLSSKKITRRDFIKSASYAIASSGMAGLVGCSAFRPRPEYSDTLCLTSPLTAEPLVRKQVFETAKISSIRFNNRIIRSATAMGLADKDGKPTDAGISKHVELASGGAGAIIYEGTAVMKNGQHAYLNPQLFDRDAYIKDYRKISSVVHKHNTPIILQAFHAGRQTRSAITGEPTVAPSAITDVYYNEETPKELTDSEILEIIDHFVLTIERAKKAEFDGVQLNAAHGYLLSEFLSPAMNEREDRWGGSTENRFRIIKEIVERSRKRVGNYPIIIKINAYDFQSDGMRMDEAVKIAKMLENVGCDAIEVSCGVRDDGFSSLRVPEFPTEAILKYSFRAKDQPYLAKKMMGLMLPMMIDLHEPIDNFNVCAAQQIKSQVTIPVIVVGGIKDLSVIKQIISGNMADFTAMSRAFIIEPDIANSFKTNQQTTSECISCGLCGVCMEELPVACHYGRLS